MKDSLSINRLPIFCGNDRSARIHAQRDQHRAGRPQPLRPARRTGNLVGDPAHAAELERHRKILADWIVATGDKGQNPEDDAGLIQVLYEWRDKCVNPEYEKLRELIEPVAKPSK